MNVQKSPCFLRHEKWWLYVSHVRIKHCDWARENMRQFDLCGIKFVRAKWTLQICFQSCTATCISAKNSKSNGYIHKYPRQWTYNLFSPPNSWTSKSVNFAVECCSPYWRITSKQPFSSKFKLAIRKLFLKLTCCLITGHIVQHQIKCYLRICKHRRIKNLKVGLGAGGWKFIKWCHGCLSQLQGLQWNYSNQHLDRLLDPVMMINLGELFLSNIMIMARSSLQL